MAVLEMQKSEYKSKQEFLTELRESCVEAKEKVLLLRSGALKREDIPNWRVKLHG